MDLATGIPNPIDVYRKQPPALPVPSPVDVQMASPLALPTGAAPIVSKIPTQLETLQTKRNADVNAGSGVDQISNPFLRGLARVGDVTASVFAPGIARSIPGTTLHHEMLLGRENAKINQLQAEQKDQAGIAESGARAAQDTANAAHLNAETPEVAPNAASNRNLQGAEARHINDEANDLENPQPQFEVHDTDAGPLFINKATGEAQHINVDGKPVGPKIQTDTVQLQIGGKPHQVLVNKASGDLIKDLGESGIKPPTVHISTGESRQAKNDILKAYQPTLDSAERLNVMTESYEKAVKNHDQQAMLNLLANHLGMTMGLQKGARLTKDIIHEAQQSQPWLAGIKAHYDKDGYLSGVALGPEQMRQMVELGQQRYAEDAKKSRSTAQYLGAPDDGPERVPGEATIRYYVAKANGDPAKAKQLAIADGWTVK